MAELSTYQITKHILKKHGIHTKKKYGQNFLTDDGVLADIIEAADITEEDAVLEIGPGIGTLTSLLAQHAGQVYAVEVDRNLIPVLKDVLSAYDNINIINADIQKTDIDELLSEEKRRIKVVANLPYYITTPIVMSLLESKSRFYSMTFMVQEEVARRMVRGPGSREYGALSLAVQYYTEPEIMFTVPPESFIPRPKVNSAVIRLIRYETPPVEADEELLFRLFRAAFNQRRKTLVNALDHGAGLGMQKSEIADTIRAAGLPENVRPEQLSLDEYAALARALGKH